MAKHRITLTGGSGLIISKDYRKKPRKKKERHVTPGKKTPPMKNTFPIDKRTSPKEETVNSTVDQQEKRAATITKIGNETIRTSIVKEYTEYYRDSLDLMSQSERDKTLAALKTALSNIDFVNGQITIFEEYSLPVHFAFLTDKGVILLCGLSSDSFVFYSAVNKTGLSVIPMQTSKKSTHPEEKWTLSEKASIPACLWTTISYFSFEFFKQMISEYYMYYEERKSGRVEKTRIPLSWKLSF